MTHAPLVHSLLAGTLGLALLVGCQTPPSAPVGPEGQPAAPAAQTVQPLGISGKADLNGVAFGNAELKIYRPGQAEPLAVGQTNEDGSFSLQVGQIIAAGGGNVIGHDSGSIISTGGGNVIGHDSGSIISTGGGNIIAAGGGNFASAGAPLRVVASKEGQTLAGLGTASIIAAGGGNIIAAGGGNIIAAGGGNIIAAGGGNYRVQQLTRREVALTVASTLAMIALGDRLDGAAAASVSSDGRVFDQAVESVLAAFDKLSAAAVATLEASPTRETLQAEVLRVLSPEGRGRLPESVAKQITGTSPAIQTAFREAANLLAQAIQTGVTAGGVAPSDSSTAPLTFGDATAPTVTVPTPTASAPPAPTTAPSQASATGGGSGVERLEPLTSSGALGIWGNFDTPARGMAVFGTMLSSAWNATVSSGSAGAATSGVYHFQPAAAGGYVEFALKADQINQITLSDFDGIRLTVRSSVENASLDLALHDAAGTHIRSFSLSGAYGALPTEGWVTYDIPWNSVEFNGLSYSMVETVKRIRLQAPATQTTPPTFSIDELSIRDISFDQLPLL